jgi:uncharacterized protein YjiS (DUF1127 family)
MPLSASRCITTKFVLMGVVPARARALTARLVDFRTADSAGAGERDVVVRPLSTACCRWRQSMRTSSRSPPNGLSTTTMSCTPGTALAQLLEALCSWGAEQRGRWAGLSVRLDDPLSMYRCTAPSSCTRSQRLTQQRLQRGVCSSYRSAGRRPRTRRQRALQCSLTCSLTVC